ncbi:hypothetical protein O6H91_Y554900 [Diphasiastrum complanatum]|nr:hypothetical protein O6H91_Y554900 [Diphasiastrum complanatum]
MLNSSLGWILHAKTLPQQWIFTLNLQGIQKIQEPPLHYKLHVHGIFFHACSFVMWLSRFFHSCSMQSFAHPHSGLHWPSSQWLKTSLLHTYSFMSISFCSMASPQLFNMFARLFPSLQPSSGFYPL